MYIHIYGERESNFPIYNLYTVIYTDRVFILLKVILFMI